MRTVVLLSPVPTMQRPRGITSQKKTDLLLLAKAMPSHKAAFFENMEVNNEAEDPETREDF